MLELEELSTHSSLDLGLTRLLKEDYEVIVGRFLRQNLGLCLPDFQGSAVNLSNIVVTTWSSDHG